MLSFALQSGSCGNCYYYESGDVKLLFDAGISWRTAAQRLQAKGCTPDGIRGIFISHDHGDHTGCAGVFHRKLKAPLFCTRKTYSAMRSRLGKVHEHGLQYFRPGDVVDVGHVRVETFLTPHDAADPCAFIVDDGATRVGILTDLGHCFNDLKLALAEVDAVFLESNYDEEMLANNLDYSQHLKWRIRSPHGHLENTESAELIRDYASDRLQTAVLCHLSGENNCPRVALETHQRVLRDRTNLALHVSPRTAASPALVLNGRRYEQACLF